jgi:hypothetical protein
MDNQRHFQSIQSFDEQILQKTIADWKLRKSGNQKLKPLDKPDGRGGKPSVPNPFADAQDAPGRALTDPAV